MLPGREAILDPHQQEGEPMTSRVEAFTRKAQSGQWMVEVWRDGGPIECIAGLETELDAIDEASNLAEHYDGLEFVITQGRERPTP
jgi:hypothetical protein